MLTKLDRFLVLLDRWDHPDGHALAARLRHAGGKSGQAHVLESALHMRSPWIRANAVIILGLIGERSSVDGLVAALSDIDRDVRVGAAKSLAMIYDRRATGGLVRALTDAEWEVRQEAASALAVLRDPECLPALCGLAGDPAWPVRLALARALGAFDGSDSFPTLFKLMSDEQSKVRLAALDQAPKLPVSEALEILHLALGDADSRIRHHAVWCATRIPDDRVMDVLKSVLFDAEESVRLMAAAEIGLRAQPGDLPLLLDLMRCRAPELRPSIAPALGRIGGREAVLALVEALDSNQQEVRLCASQALMTCAMFSNDPALRLALPKLRRLERQAQGVLRDRSKWSAVCYRETMHMIEHVTREKGALPVATQASGTVKDTLPLPSSDAVAAS